VSPHCCSAVVDPWEDRDCSSQCYKHTSNSTDPYRRELSWLHRCICVDNGFWFRLQVGRVGCFVAGDRTTMDRQFVISTKTERKHETDPAMSIRDLLMRVWLATVIA
jgi:hypothetical protein